MPILAEYVDAAKYSKEYVEKVVALVKTRINFLKDLWEQSWFFFKAPVEYAEKDIRKRWKEDTPQIMRALVEVLRGIEDFSCANTEEIVLKWITDHEYHMGNVMNAFRLTVVGECKGPHMFNITELIGKDETIARIERGIAEIKPL